MEYYFKGRIEKIRKKNWEESVFCGTFIQDDKFAKFKPKSEEELKYIWSQYFKKPSIKIRDILFESYVWYTAYIAHYAYLKYRHKYDYNYDWYLSFAMEQLLNCIPIYELETSSFYTYILNTFKLKLGRQLLVESSLGSTMGAGTIQRYINTMYKIEQCDLTVEDVLDMSDCEFECTFGYKKKIFDRMIFYGTKIYSTNFEVNQSEDDYFELGDKLTDNRINREYELIDAKIDTYNISKMVEEFCIKRDSKNGLRNFKMWFAYVSGEENSLEDVGNEFGISRERVRQIVSKTNKLLRNNKNIKKYYAEVKN